MSASELKRAEKARKMRERLRNARHHILGTIAPAPEPGTVFDPLPMFFDPGWMDSLRTVAMARIRRAGVGETGDIPAGYTRAQIRAAAQSQAFDGFLERFLGRDYKRAGITAPETARAVLSTLRIAERSFWRSPGEHREGKRLWFPYNRAQDSRTPDPRRVFHAARGSAEDTGALLGQEDDSPAGKTVPVRGGNYQPTGHGKMVAVDREVGVFTAAVILDGDSVSPCEESQEYAILATRWKMERKRGAVQSFPACEVDPGKPAAKMSFSRQPLPSLPAWSDDGGEVCNRTTARRLQPLPPVDRARAVANLRRRGRAFPRGSGERVAIAATLRGWR